MTQHYLVGEMSLLLAQMQAAMTSEQEATEIEQLRHRAETEPPSALPGIAARVLEVADRACWESLAAARSDAFTRQALAGADVWEFSLCARLCQEPPAPKHDSDEA